MAPADENRVYIFDTTLRDGEQAPGFALNVEEKVEIAHQLARLGVDVIEAGFPISSPGDFTACQRIARGPMNNDRATLRSGLDPADMPNSQRSNTVICVPCWAACWISCK